MESEIRISSRPLPADPFPVTLALLRRLRTSKHRLFFQERSKTGQLAENYLDILGHIIAPAGIRNIDQMDEQSRALDVPQELRPQPRARVRPFAQPRNVRDYEA